MTVDITSELQIHSLHARQKASCCSACERRLLPGETLNVYESGQALCTLCAAAAPSEPVKRERIRARSTRLSVVPRAA
jgi:RNase P subunit RPR2